MQIHISVEDQRLELREHGAVVPEFSRLHVRARPGVRAGQLQDADGPLPHLGEDRGRRGDRRGVQGPRADRRERRGRGGGRSHPHAHPAAGRVGRGEREHAGALHLHPRDEPRGGDRRRGEPRMRADAQRGCRRVIRIGRDRGGSIHTAGKIAFAEVGSRKEDENLLFSPGKHPK